MRTRVPDQVSLSANSSLDPRVESQTDLLETQTMGQKLRNRENLKAPRHLIEMMIAAVNESKSYIETMNSTDKMHWEAAMKEEMFSLEENSTWDYVKLPVGRKAISNRWVYQVKRNVDGKISRYKARLVVRGFSQREGIDYNETFSPVARFDTIRVVISIAAKDKLELTQFNVKTAFLNTEKPL